MPRLLPKLIQRIINSQYGPLAKSPRNIPSPSRKRRRTIPKALPPPTFSPRGRTQSILLDNTNPIIHSDAFVHHKSDAPIRPSDAGRGKHVNSSRQVREMTEKECKWWSDPYLRMLASPLRQCLVTQKQLPADLMTRLAVLRTSGPRISQPVAVLLPDGVEHPRFRRRNSGRGHYLTCHKIFIDEMSYRSSHKRIPVPNVRVHSLLAMQIGHQLRLRVLQELELLSEALRCAPQGSLENTVLRRLTRTEWAEVKIAGRISQPGAVAVLVVPPLNKPKPSEVSVVAGSNSDKPEQLPPRAFATLPPLSVLHGTKTPHDYDDSLFSPAEVPLYNGLALFPIRSMRSKLYRALQNALLVERRARWRQGAPAQGTERTFNEPDERSPRNKASHAYLLRSDEKTVRRADSVPLAVALWRVRMWEGQGWEDDRGYYGIWESKYHEGQLEH